MPKAMDDYKETIFWTRQGSCTLEFTKLGQYVQNLCKSKPDQTDPTMEKGVEHTIPPLAGSYWQLSAARKGRNGF